MSIRMLNSPLHTPFPLNISRMPACSPARRPPSHYPHRRRLSGANRVSGLRIQPLEGAATTSGRPLRTSTTLRQFMKHGPASRFIYRTPPSSRTRPSLDSFIRRYFLFYGRRPSSASFIPVICRRPRAAIFSFTSLLIKKISIAAHNNIRGAIYSPMG